MAQTLHERPAPHDDEPRNIVPDKKRRSIGEILNTPARKVGAGVAAIVMAGGAALGVNAAVGGAEKSPQEGTSQAGDTPVDNGEPMHFDDSDGDRNNDGRKDFNTDLNNNGKSDDLDLWVNGEFVDDAVAAQQEQGYEQAVANATSEELADISQIEAAYPDIADDEPNWKGMFVQAPDVVQAYVMAILERQSSFDTEDQWHAEILSGLTMTEGEIQEGADNA